MFLDREHKPRPTQVMPYESRSTIIGGSDTKPNSWNYKATDLDDDKDDTDDNLKGETVQDEWSMDAGLKTATGMYGKKVRHAANRVARPVRRRRTEQRRRGDAARSLPWWAREETLLEVKQEDDGTSDSQMPQTEDDAADADPVDDAMASLPRFESLQYTAQSEGASRKARSSPPALRKGDGDPSWHGRYCTPCVQGPWEDEADGGPGATQDESGDAEEVASSLAPSTRNAAGTAHVRSGSTMTQSSKDSAPTPSFAIRRLRMGGGRKRPAETAKNRTSTSRQASAAIQNRKGPRGTTTATMQSGTGPRATTTATAPRLTKLRLSVRPTKIAPWRGIVTKYWKKFDQRRREWAAWQSWQDNFSWQRDSPGWGSGGGGEG